ncbi:MAG TPA: histidine kinase [Bryobacteraceae bacterium]|jgi:two-component system LytT family sensor kinase|nr:histidine kinase [Bryobacteraceae bacterium]
MLEQHLPTLLIKLAVAASLASLLARSSLFRRMLHREERTLSQRIQLALSFGVIFGASVATRVVTVIYKAVDLGLEGSMLAGVLGGYVTGLIAGVLISIPAMMNGEFLSMPLFAGVGVLGGILRDLAPEKEEIWRFSPFYDLSLYRLIRRQMEPRVAIFHLGFLCVLIAAELLRWSALSIFQVNPNSDAGHTPFGVLFSIYTPNETQFWDAVAIFTSTIFAITLPLKVWNAMRNEDKLESQQRLLNEARLAALTRQINPHFLFNALNSISTLIRIDPDQARTTLLKLSSILRRVMQKQENLTPLRNELQFVDDYMAIEMVRFGDKLTFDKELDPSSLDTLVPSMVLQPLVENSIKHGLSRKLDGGMIRVRSRLQDGRLVLSVEDNGVGIPDAELAKLFEQGIGISNVNERLSVIYGNDYRMSIDSKLGQGTHTQIEIPASRAPKAAVS